MTDREIVELYWAWNEDAVRQTQKEYDKYLTKIAYNILADIEDSREAVNDTYLAAWNSMPENRPAVLSTYLGKITRRNAIDMIRRKSSRKRGGSEYQISLEELGDCVSGHDSVEEAIDYTLLVNTIYRFLSESSEEEQNLFIGRYYFFDSLKEVAAYCGMSESKAKSALFRIRQRLKKYLTEEGFVI